MQSYRLCAQDNKDGRSVQSRLGAALLFNAIDTCCIRFYVEKGSAIQCIKPPDHEKVSFPSYKIHNGKPDGVGPVG